MPCQDFVAMHERLQLPSPEVIKLFTCPIQFSIKFVLPINTKMLKNTAFSCFQILRCFINHANKCYNANKCLYFNIYERDKAYAQLSCS